MNVGVYYGANAVGRMVGTLASGALFSYVGSTVVDGFGACLFASLAFAGISSVVDAFLHDGAGECFLQLPRMLAGCRSRPERRLPPAGLPLTGHAWHAEEKWYGPLVSCCIRRKARPDTAKAAAEAAEEQPAAQDSALEGTAGSTTGQLLKPA